MIESIYATGLPFAGRSDLPETLKDLAQLLPACAGVRRWGAAALDLAYVAAGRYDGYWERRLNLWDIAAGVIIAREAGAIVEGIAANSDPVETADILCANDLQFNQFAALIRGA
jgi:myo-inositol-1(or 4)-monophosphatase